MAKFRQVSSHWYTKVVQYDELPSGKVYYSEDGKRYHVANREEFIDADEKDFSMQLGKTLYRISNTRYYS